MSKLGSSERRTEGGNAAIPFIMFEIWEIIQWNKAIKITLGHGKVHSRYV